MTGSSTVRSRVTSIIHASPVTPPSPITPRSRSLSLKQGHCDLRFRVSLPTSTYRQMVRLWASWYGRMRESWSRSRLGLDFRGRSQTTARRRFDFTEWMTGKNWAPGSLRGALSHTSNGCRDSEHLRLWTHAMIAHGIFGTF